MKKESEPKNVFKTLYGIEHDGRLLPHLCAPSQMIDYTSGGYEHTGDAYYNSWPKGYDEKTSQWKMIKHGLHVTKFLNDVRLLLEEKDNFEVIITKKCVEQLVKEGYEIRLKRYRVITNTHTLEMEVMHHPNWPTPHLEVKKDEMKTERFGNWRI